MGSTKFDRIDYTNTFAKRISVMHGLVKSVLPDLINDGDIIIDIGGGPGIGAKLIDELEIKATVTNIEPSDMIHEIPDTNQVKYNPLRMSFKEALDANMDTADFILMVSSAHEIALCNQKLPEENKKIFFFDLEMFIRKNLKSDGMILIGFPNYREDASGTEIDRQRRLTESLLGHSHPPDEFFRLEEFTRILGTEPSFFLQEPMALDNDPEDTVLLANVAAFKLS